MTCSWKNFRKILAKLTLLNSQSHSRTFKFSSLSFRFFDEVTVLNFYPGFCLEGCVHNYITAY